MEKQKTQALSASDDRRPRPPGESLAAGELDHPPTPNPRASTAIAISEVFPYLARRHLPGSAPPPPPGFHGSAAAAAASVRVNSESAVGGVEVEDDESRRELGDGLTFGPYGRIQAHIWAERLGRIEAHFWAELMRMVRRAEQTRERWSVGV